MRSREDRSPSLDLCKQEQTTRRDMSLMRHTCSLQPPGLLITSIISAAPPQSPPHPSRFFSSRTSHGVHRHMLLHLRGPVYIHRNIRRRRFLNIPTMIGSTFATHSTEIVYDSEPERIQVRVDRRQRKLQKLKAAPPDDPSTERTRNVAHNHDRACSVIELTGQAI